VGVIGIGRDEDSHKLFSLMIKGIFAVF
jgi:hypothetical protein